MENRIKECHLGLYADRTSSATKRAVKDIGRAIRKCHSVEEKICIVLDVLRGAKRESG